MRLVRAGLIAGIYVLLIFLFQPVSFGYIQFRLAEALVVLPILYAEAVPGLFVGVLLGNILGGLGPWDIFGGSLITLLAAYLTRRYRHSWIAFASPIVLNGLLVSLYLAPILGQPYWLVALGITVSEAVVVFAAGVPLLLALRRIGVSAQ